jgi:hypothetical protein
LGIASVAEGTSSDQHCHPEEAESHAKRATPNEGPMQPACSATDADIDADSDPDREGHQCRKMERFCFFH